MKKTLECLLIALIATSFLTLNAQVNDQAEDKPVYGVSQMPQYPGGDEALLNFIKNNLKYPAVAAEKGVEGRVFVRFVVNREGRVTDVTVIRSLDSICDNEAVRVIKLMPTWKPGMKDGKPVSVYYTLPIVYKLKKDGMDDKKPLLIVDGQRKPYELLKDTSLLKPYQINSVRVVKDSSEIAKYGPQAKYGVILIETKEHAASIENAIKNNQAISNFDVSPQFPGGEEALIAFISGNLRYPSEAASRGIEGRSTIRFIVTKTGKISEIAVVRGLCESCDAEAIRVVKMMPDWKPGTLKGQPVNIYYTLPVVFKLNRR